MIKVKDYVCIWDQFILLFALFYFIFILNVCQNMLVFEKEWRKSKDLKVCVQKLKNKQNTGPKQTLNVYLNLKFYYLTNWFIIFKHIM